MSATLLRAETGTTQGIPTQVSTHIGNDGHRQRYAHRAGTTLTWTRQNRHDAALCHGQSEQRKAGTPQIYWLTVDELSFIPPLFCFRDRIFVAK